MASWCIWHLRPAVAKWPLYMPYEHNANCSNSKVCYCVYISGLLAFSSAKQNGKFPPVQNRKIDLMTWYQ